MNPVRRILAAIAVATTLSLVGLSAPAQADITWGYMAPVDKPAKVKK